MRGLFVTAFVICLTLALFVFNWRAEPLPFSADAIVVHKRAHTLDLLHHGQIMREYHVALGRGGLASKERAGDNRVPEGEYIIVVHNPRSTFHQALRIGYPTPRQTIEARQHGINPGSDIMIHGTRNGLGWLGPLHRLIDWTKGCIAVTDAEIDVIARAVPDGTPITITR